MKLVFSSQAWDDYLYWQRTDRKVLKRINDIIREIIRTPFWRNWSARGLAPRPGRLLVERIDDEHRLVYKVEKDAVLIGQLRYHY